MRPCHQPPHLTTPISTLSRSSQTCPRLQHQLRPLTLRPANVKQQLQLQRLLKGCITQFSNHLTQLRQTNSPIPKQNGSRQQGLISRRLFFNSNYSISSSLTRTQEFSLPTANSLMDAASKFSSMAQLTPVLSKGNSSHLSHQRNITYKSA